MAAGGPVDLSLRTRRKLRLEEFLRQNLDEAPSCRVIQWVDRNSGRFRILWTHQSSGAFCADDAALFRYWALARGKIPSTSSVELKQSLRMALNKSPSVDRIQGNTDEYRYFQFTCWNKESSDKYYSLSEGEYSPDVISPVSPPFKYNLSALEGPKFCTKHSESPDTSLCSLESTSFGSPESSLQSSRSSLLSSRGHHRASVGSSFEFSNSTSSSFDSVKSPTDSPVWSPTNICPNNNTRGQESIDLPHHYFQFHKFITEKYYKEVTNIHSNNNEDPRGGNVSPSNIDYQQLKLGHNNGGKNNPTS